MEVKCTQCGGGVPIKENQGLATCPFCGSSLYLDLTEGVGHFLEKAVIAEKNLTMLVVTWLGRKERHGTIKVTRSSLVFWPFWEVQDTGPGAVQTFLGAAHPITAMQHAKVPAGELRPFTEGELETGHGLASVQPPQYTVHEFLEKEGLSTEKGDQKTALKVWLLHIPFWQVEYVCDGVSYEIWMDAISGEMFADDLPPTFAKSKDRIYQRAVGMIFLVYLITGAFIPNGNWSIVLMAAVSLPLYFIVREMVKEEAG